MNDQVQDTQTQETQTTQEQAIHPKLAQAIKVNFNNMVDVVPVKFNFKTQDVKDSEGNVIGTSKRPSVELNLPVPSVEGIVKILTDEGNEKSLALLREAIQDIVVARARDIINEDENISEESFPYEALVWETIANLPKAERRGGGISKETWEEFAKDYIAVMPGVTGKKKESVELAAKVFVERFSKVKTDKPVLKLLKDQLALYTSSSSNAEKFSEVLDFLNNKAKTLIEADSSKLLDNL